VQLIQNPNELSVGRRKVSLAIGMFDGVHLGHQQVIRQAIYDARQHHGLSIAITFDCHPAQVLAPAKAPRLIYSLPQKLREIDALGVSACLLFHFDHGFSEQSGKSFIEHLARELGDIYSICVGSNFTFGHKRSGNVALLNSLGAELGFKVHGLAAVSLNELPVSSTRIRQAISSGDLDGASQMLGRTYSLAGLVVRGQQLGRKMAVPTANIDVRGLITPPSGVYAVRCKTPIGWSEGVANIGVRPTVSATPNLVLEVHLFDFDNDIYDREVEVEFVQFIRDEKKFESLASLKQQIERDIAAAQSIL
jgi:riboflavin kinase / FMN adenylyltransferase